MLTFIPDQNNKNTNYNRKSKITKSQIKFSVVNLNTLPTI